MSSSEVLKSNVIIPQLKTPAMKRQPSFMKMFIINAVKTRGNKLAVEYLHSWHENYSSTLTT